MARSYINCYFGAYGTLDAGTVQNLRTTEQGSTAVTLAADEYPTRIVFHTGEDSPGAVVNSHPRTDAYPTAYLYLTQSGSTSTNFLLGTWETYNGDYYSYTSTGVRVLIRNRYYIYNGVDTTVSNAQSLAGKTLAIYVAGGSGASFQNVAKVTVYLGSLNLSVTVNNSTGGTVTTNKTTATPGTTVTLTRSASTGYEFSAWNPTPSSLSINSSGQFTMPSSNVTINPIWTKINYAITKVVSPSGAGTITAPSTSTYGATVTLSQTPMFTWEFVGWSVSAGTLSGNTLTMPASAVTVTATYVRSAHTLIWTDASLTITQNNKIIVAKKGGYATDNYGEDVSYELWRDGEKVADFAVNTAMIKLDDTDSGVEAEYSVVARSSLVTIGTTETFTATFPANWQAGYYDGTTVQKCLMYYYDGSSWVECEGQYYDGQAWHEVATS